MTTKNFAQMTTKKLNALLATASDKDKKAIEAVLKAREQAQASADDGNDALLTPEEETAVKAAEENGGLNPRYNWVIEKKKRRLTDEERSLLAAELKKNVYHRCQVVPFNSVDWVDGYIAGVIEEKRTNKVLYAIKTDDGRRIVKVYDSKLILISSETIERPERAKRVRAPKSQTPDIEKPILTPEMIKEEIKKVTCNVGKLVKYEKYTTVNKETGEERTEYTEGRIIAIVPDYRSQNIFYKISILAPVEGNPFATKITHKAITNTGLIIAEDFDDEQGRELNAKYLGRYAAAAARSAITPQTRYAKCEEIVRKAEEKLQKVTAELEAKKKQLEAAKAELDAFLAAQAQGTQQNAEKTEEEPLA